MKKYQKIVSLLILGSLLISCGGGDDAPKTTKTTSITAVAADGKIFYQYECGGCHSAGKDDGISAFASSDLAQKQNLIKANLSEFGATGINNVENIMGRFSNLSEQRVADLKAYLKSL